MFCAGSKGPGPSGSLSSFPLTCLCSLLPWDPQPPPLPSSSFLKTASLVVLFWVLPPETWNAEMHPFSTLYPHPHEWGDGATLLQNRQWLQVFLCYSWALFAIPNGEDTSFLRLFSACLCIPERPNRDSGHNWPSGTDVGLSLLGWRLLRESRVLASLLHRLGLGSVGMVVHCSMSYQGVKPLVFLLCEVAVESGPWGFGYLRAPGSHLQRL